MHREVAPFVMALALLGAAAPLLDAALHFTDAVWIGRYLGIPGVLLILVSLIYSLLVLVHAGIHFNSILGWLAVWAMLITVASGLSGTYLLKRAARRMEETRRHMTADGLSAEAQTERLYWDSMTFDAIRHWRVVHVPITLAFAVLAIAHVLSIFVFRGWR